jgi:hypothetical protein
VPFATKLSDITAGTSQTMTCPQVWYQFLS